MNILVQRFFFDSGCCAESARSTTYHYFTKTWLCHVLADKAPPHTKQVNGISLYLERDWHRRLCAVAIDTALSLSRTWHWQGGQQHMIIIRHHRSVVRCWPWAGTSPPWLLYATI